MRWVRTEHAENQPQAGALGNPHFSSWKRMESEKLNARFGEVVVALRVDDIAPSG